MALNANDPRPQHQQIADDLRQQIASGALAPGDRLPTIKDLMAHYGVYNQTVQAALKALQSESLTEGVPGRGTFVKEDIDVDALTHGVASGEPSPEYVVLRDQLEVLAGEVRDIRQQLNELVAERSAAKVRKPVRKR